MILFEFSNISKILFILLLFFYLRFIRRKFFDIFTKKTYNLAFLRNNYFLEFFRLGLLNQTVSGGLSEYITDMGIIILCNFTEQLFFSFHTSATLILFNSWLMT